MTFFTSSRIYTILLLLLLMIGLFFSSTQLNQTVFAEETETSSNEEADEDCGTFNILCHIQKFARNSLKDLAKSTVKGSFNVLDGAISFAKGEMEKNPEQFSGQIYTIVKNLNLNVMIPIGVLLIAFFFVYELFLYLEKISIHQANVDPSMPLYLTLKFIFSAVIIRFSFDIVEGILKFGTWMVKQAGLSVNGSTADATSILLAAVQNENNIGALAFYVLLFFISSLAMFAMYIVIGSTIVGRFIKIYYYIAVSPIPLSSLMSDEQSSIAKGYVRQFFAIMLEGVLILVLLSMAGALLGDVILSDSAGSVVMILLKIFVFCFAFVKAVAQCGTVASKIVNG